MDSVRVPAGHPRFKPGDTVIFRRDIDTSKRYYCEDRGGDWILFEEDKAYLLEQFGYVATIRDIDAGFYQIEGGSLWLFADCWIEGLYEEDFQAQEVSDSDLFNLIGG